MATTVHNTVRVTRIIRGLWVHYRLGYVRIMNYKFDYPRGVVYAPWLIKLWILCVFMCIISALSTVLCAFYVLYKKGKVGRERACTNRPQTSPGAGKKPQEKHNK